MLNKQKQNLLKVYNMQNQDFKLFGGPSACSPPFSDLFILPQYIIHRFHQTTNRISASLRRCTHSLSRNLRLRSLRIAYSRLFSWVNLWVLECYVQPFLVKNILISECDQYLGRHFSAIGIFKHAGFQHHWVCLMKPLHPVAFRVNQKCWPRTSLLLVIQPFVESKYL